MSLREGEGHDSEKFEWKIYNLTMLLVQFLGTYMKTSRLQFDLSWFQSIRSFLISYVSDLHQNLFCSLHVCIQ